MIEKLANYFFLLQLFVITSYPLFLSIMIYEYDTKQKTEDACAYHHCVMYDVHSHCLELIKVRPCYVDVDRVLECMYTYM